MPLSTQSDAAMTEGTFVFLSELLGARVQTREGKRLGVLVDLLADANEAAYPKVLSLRVRPSVLRPGDMFRVAWAEVVSCEPGLVVVKAEAALQPLHHPPGEIPLSQDVLDRQILDTDDAKVERVNDLHLLRARGDLRVAHVDVGFRGLVRRMGWQRPFDLFVKATRGPSWTQVEKFVPWKHVQPLSAGSTRVKLDVARTSLSEVHPADMAEILADLDRRERAVLFRELPMEAAADALEEADPGLQRELLSMVEPERAADLVEAMEPDAAADLIAELPQEEAQELLEEMQPEERHEVQQLLTYDEDTAGGLMNPDFLQVAPTATVATALEDVRTQAVHVPRVHDVYVVGAEGRAVGVLSLRELLLGKPEEHMIALMHDHPAPVKPDVPVRELGELFAKYNLLSVPVEDDAGRLLGVITVDDVLVRVLRG